MTVATSPVEASAPARIDLAGGTLDLWPLHVLHPGSVTVNVAIDRRASCRARFSPDGWRVRALERRFDLRAKTTGELLSDPGASLVGSLAEALGVVEPLDVELASGVPFGSGLGGSSALAVALVGALEPFSSRRPTVGDTVDLVRDAETRVLGKPAGVQDYYPPLWGGLQRIWLEPGRTRRERDEMDAALWDRHLTLFDTGASHSSGMNNWEVFRARLEGDGSVAEHLEEVRRAAVAMARASEALDFPAMGAALGREWEARRRLAPVVSTPTIEKSVAAGRAAGAWAGKACGAGGGGCVVFLSPAERTSEVRRALAGLGEGSVLAIRVENRGLTVASG